MQISGAPAQLVEAWATGDGSKTNPIPVPSQIGITPGRASWTDGFVPLNGTPITSGGIPPFKSDMNGGLFQMSAIDVWMSAGAAFPWSSAFSSAVGGYPAGARVLRAAGGYWLSAVDNNTTDPDTGGAGWVPGGGLAPIASVYASAPATNATGTNKVFFDTVEFDSFSLWNAGATRFQAPWAGKYRISGALQLPAAPAGNIAVLVFKNGTAARVCSEFPQISTVDLTFPFNTVLSLAAGDYLEVYLAVATNTTVGSTGTTERGVYAEFDYLGQ